MKNQNDYLTKLDEAGVHITTRPYLNKVLSHSEPYEVEIFGTNIIVLPGVMSPKYDWAGLFMISYLPEDLFGLDILEIGSGTGLVSVLCAIRGANSITAVDVNRLAVENTRLNFEKLEIANALVYESDVFSSLPVKKYDVIIFNLPYHDAEPVTDLERGVMDKNYIVMEKFLSGAKFFMKENSELYVGFSKSGNVKHFLSKVRENEFTIEDMKEQDYWEDIRYAGPDFTYNCQLYRLRKNHS
jgi:release factor glutamine methyltransferase